LKNFPAAGVRKAAAPDSTTGNLGQQIRDRRLASAAAGTSPGQPGDGFQIVDTLFDKRPDFRFGRTAAMAEEVRFSVRPGINHREAYA
jgi:hypothetical protein